MKNLLINQMIGKMETIHIHKLKHGNLQWVKTIATISCLLALLVCSHPSSKGFEKVVGSNPEYRGSSDQVPVLLSRIQAPSFPDRAPRVTDAPYNAIAEGIIRG
jgi:hypothetical protein